MGHVGGKAHKLSGSCILIFLLLVVENWIITAYNILLLQPAPGSFKTKKVNRNTQHGQRVKRQGVISKTDLKSKTGDFMYERFLQVSGVLVFHGTFANKKVLESLSIALI